MVPRRSLELEWRQMVRLPAEWGERVERLANERGIAVAAMLRLIIRRGLDVIERENGTQQ
jgi:predicted DNA-binding protein